MGVIRCLRLRGLRGLQDSGSCLEGEARRLGSCPLSALPSLRLALLWYGVFSYPLATILCGGGSVSRVHFFAHVRFWSLPLHRSECYCCTVFRATAPVQHQVYI